MRIKARDTKAASILLLTGCVVCAALRGLQARAEFEVTASAGIRSSADFDNPLAPLGTWASVGNLGRCWRPSGVGPGWRPYCDGEWVWTDCGWYWQSNEPWGWACYHYGSWYADPAMGWVWVPGTEWAPAWVTWRSGGGYIGWAPMPPPGLPVALIQNHFVFMPASQFQDPIRPSVVIANSAAAFERTRTINNLTHETKAFAGETRHRVVINKGPGTEIVQKATGRRVNTVPIQEAARRSVMPVRRTAPAENNVRSNLKNDAVRATKPMSPAREGNTVQENQPAKPAPSELPKLPPAEFPRSVPSESQRLTPHQLPRTPPAVPPNVSPNAGPVQPERRPLPEPPPQPREDHPR
jgi:hypothetical protein